MKTDMLCYRDAQRSIRQQYPEYNPEGYVFCQENGAPYEPRTYQDLFKRCVSRAVIREANFHALRHTFATRALEQGDGPGDPLQTAGPRQRVHYAGQIRAFLRVTETGEHGADGLSVRAGHGAGAERPASAMKP